MAICLCGFCASALKQKYPEPNQCPYHAVIVREAQGVTLVKPLCKPSEFLFPPSATLPWRKGRECAILSAWRNSIVRQGRRPPGRQEASHERALARGCPWLRPERTRRRERIHFHFRTFPFMRRFMHTAGSVSWLPASGLVRILRRATRPHWSARIRIRLQLRDSARLSRASVFHVAKRRILYAFLRPDTSMTNICSVITGIVHAPVRNERLGLNPTRRSTGTDMSPMANRLPTV